ncbi:MAG TPA: Uma2 family endonuclease, partial [Bacteroidia bacterium]|nr:Uma2 family endonuclease [Bacteroidia bacterium]
DSAVLSADVSWVSRDRLAQIPKAEWNKFARVCPEFVVEVLSPSDSVKVTEKKMHQWIANGAELGWMINPVKETIKIFRPGQDATTVKGFDQQLIAGDPMPGFVLDLQQLRSLIA